MVDLTNVIFNLPAICLHLLAQNFVYGNSAKFCYFFRSLQLIQTGNCSKNYVLLITGAERLRTNIFKSCKFQNGTSRTTGDDTGTFWRLFHQYGCTAELTNEVMRNTLVLIQRYFDEFLHCVFFSFTDCFRDFHCFSQTCTNVSVVVTNNNESCESHVTSALNNLGYTFN